MRNTRFDADSLRGTMVAWRAGVLFSRWDQVVGATVAQEREKAGALFGEAAAQWEVERQQAAQIILEVQQRTASELESLEKSWQQLRKSVGTVGGLYRNPVVPIFR